MFQIFADRDENVTILMCEKHTLGGALCFAADMADHWDKLTVIHKTEETEEVVAVIAMKGV